MARSKDFSFPLAAKIELVASRNNEIFKKIMTYEEALNIPKKKGWHYQCYEIGFSQF